MDKKQPDQEKERGNEKMKFTRRMWGVLASVLYKTHSEYAVPTNLGVAVTSQCNINCKYCMRQEFKPHGGHMSLKRLRWLLKEMPYISGVCIMGLCEPYLNPELPEMLKWLKSNGYSISLTTNGTIPIEDIEALTCVDDFVFSIDTNDPETFRYLRGGAELDDVVCNLDRVIKWKRKHGLTATDNPPIHINSVITQQNIDDVPGLLGMLNEYADDLTYVMIDPVSREDYQHWERPLALTGDEFADKLASVHHEIRDYMDCKCLNRNMRIIGFDWMLQPSYDWSKCPLSWTGPFIESNGDVYFCYDYRRVLGNVFTDDLLKIWNNGVARAFRRQLGTDTPPLKQCRSCNFARKKWQPGGDYATQGKCKHDTE